MHGVTTQVTTVGMSSETCNRQWWPNTCQHVLPVAPVIMPGILFALVMHRGKGGDVSVLY